MSDEQSSPSADSEVLTQSQIDARVAGRGQLLPRFNGTPEDWPLFLELYRSSTVSCGYTDAENVLRLRKHLDGKAYELVRYLLLYPSTLELAIARLEMRYGTPHIISMSLLKQLENLPAPKDEERSSMMDFLLAVDGICRAIHATGHADYLNDYMTLHKLVEKLPATYHAEWIKWKADLRHATLVEFAEWIGQITRIISQI